jgi:serine/threonine-protein kinase
MSPEQLRGEQVDYRTDIFSLGTVVYEMATGQHPFCGKTSAEITSSILRDSPKPIAELRTDAPVGLQRIVDLCLAKSASERYSSMRELYEAVNRLRLEITAAPGASSVASCPQQSIAVLPFVNMSVDRENEFFADGITEEIINALAKIPQLRVAARTSSFSFKGKHIDLRIIGERLSVKTVLEGSVRRSGNRLRITAQLINLADGYQLWSERYDRDMKDIFEIQDEIARSIADRLKLALEGQDSLVKAGTKNLEAYQLYLKGRALLYRRGYAISRARECFERAVILDSEYAVAWAGLADSQQLLGFWGFLRPEVTMAKGKEAALRAVAIDPSLAEGHSALACAHLWWDWQPVQAEQEFLRALELNPRYVQARSFYANVYLQSVAGRFEEGINEARQAVESDPLSAYAAAILALTFFVAGRYSEGLHHARRALELDPDAFFTRWILQNCLHWNGNYEESVAVGETVLAVSGRSAFAVASLAVTYADWGKPADAESLYKELQARSERQYVPHIQLALVAWSTGHREGMILHARQAYELREPFIIQANHWPDFERLHQDPQFEEIVMRAGLNNAMNQITRARTSHA